MPFKVWLGFLIVMQNKNCKKGGNELVGPCQGRFSPIAIPCRISSVMLCRGRTWWNKLLSPTGSGTFNSSLCHYSCVQNCSAQIPRTFIVESRKCFEGWKDEVAKVGMNIFTFGFGWKQPENPWDGH